MDYPIIYTGGTGEVIHKKSRFIATTFPVNTEEEAIKHIESVRKKYYDARHNCFAYVIGDKNETIRSSDDGEPSGTAGHPILDVILGEKTHNALVIVTRYFGGTLLGTGGLVRAYSEATKEGLNHSILIEKKKGKKIAITIDYQDIGKLQYRIAALELTEIETKYEEKVSFFLIVPELKVDLTVKESMEITAGKAQIEELEDVFYGVLDKKVVFL